MTAPIADDNHQTTGTQRPISAHGLRLQELGAICETLSDYSEPEWDHDSYCGGWRVRDVVGHMLVGYTTPMLAMIGKLGAKRFDVDRASAVESVAFADAHTPAQLLAELERVRRDDVRMGISRVIPAAEGVVDHVIHHLDITRPLGRPTTTSPEARLAALDRIVTLGGFVRAKPRAKGLCFIAEDVPWTWGSGPEVVGPADDLLLALSGRAVGLASLSGPGAPILADRVR